jgi:hypothetical protein
MGAQLKRPQKYQKADIIRESADIEQDASLILSVEKPKPPKTSKKAKDLKEQEDSEGTEGPKSNPALLDDSIINIKVSKNRLGRSDIIKTLKFNKPAYKIIDTSY